MLSTLLLLSAANAAEVTDFPKPLGGALWVGYRGRYETGSLVEAEQDISERRIQEHHVDAQVEFSPFAGAALVVGIEGTALWKWTYPNAGQMVIEPVSGGGTYLFSPPEGELYNRSGGGLTGVWLGAALSPFSEQLFPKQQVVWRLDFAVRPGSKSSNRWTVNDGKRGAAPGGLGIRVAGAFSHQAGFADAYIRAALQHEGKAEIDLVEEDGTSLGTFEVNPGSTVEVTGGTGVLTAKDDDSSVFDIHLGVRYKSWEDLPSGMLLPYVIDAAKAVPATHSESFSGLVGMGLELNFTPNIGVTMGGRFVYTLPHRQEHLFDVTTSNDTVGAEWFFRLRGNLSRDDVQ